MREESQIAGGARDDIGGASCDSYSGLGFGPKKRRMISSGSKRKMTRAALRTEN